MVAMDDVEYGVRHEITHAQAVTHPFPDLCGGDFKLLDALAVDTATGILPEHVRIVGLCANERFREIRGVERAGTGARGYHDV
jgi:hypothetical protein